MDCHFCYAKLGLIFCKESADRIGVIAHTDQIMIAYMGV